MKVALHVGQLIQRIPGGIGRYTRSLIDFLPKDEVTLYTFACSGVPKVTLPRYTRVSRFSYRIEYELWHRIRDRDLHLVGDLVHAPSFAVPSSPNQPLVITAHDVAFIRHPHAFSRRGVQFHKKGLSIARKEACAIIVPSKFTHDELVREGVDPGLIHVIPHGITIPQEADKSSMEAVVHAVKVPKRFVLAVGTIEPRKNLSMLVGAVEEARKSGEDISLVLVGPRGWGEVKNLERDFVYVLGRVNDRILNALMRQAIVYCVPSIYEGFGMSVLDAMANKTPVIASGVASLPEVVGDAGILLDPFDSRLWSQAIIKFAQDEVFRKTQAELGFVRAKNFSWESSARGHVVAYREALQQWQNKS